MGGITLRRVPLGSPGAGIAVARLHYTADPTMTPERVAVLRSRYTSEARWRREMEIEYEALEGERLYPEYSPELNDCEPFDVSNQTQWTIWQGADPHGRTPHAHAWIAFNGRGDVAVCGELWPTGRYSIRDYVEAIQWFESDSREKPLAWEWANGKKLTVYHRVMDTHGHAIDADEGVDYFKKYAFPWDADDAAFQNEQGLRYSEAKKSDLGSVRDTIGELLAPVKTEFGPAARMRIFRTCAELRSELENVRYPQTPTGMAERSSQERPMTYRKHVIDAVHYVFAENPGFVLPPRGGDSFVPIYPGTGH